MDIRNELSTAYSAELASALLDAYAEIETNYWLGKWKASELDAGHFVEAARRILEQQLLGTHTPIGKSLPAFSDKELKRYEQVTGNESYRILIPRTLKAVYNIRNKRGVAHTGQVSPNEMDATLILYTVKWVLAEFIRLASGVDAADAQDEISQIIERRIPVLWKHGEVARILRPGIHARKQVLIHLYDNSPQSADDLRSHIEYKHKGKFRAILSDLHKQRLIEFGKDGLCVITPTGQAQAEQIIGDLQQKL